MVIVLNVSGKKLMGKILKVTDLEIIIVFTLTECIKINVRRSIIHFTYQKTLADQVCLHDLPFFLTQPDMQHKARNHPGPTGYQQEYPSQTCCP